MLFLANTLILVSLFVVLSFSVETIQADRPNECYPFDICKVNSNNAVPKQSRQEWTWSYKNDHAYTSRPPPSKSHSAHWSNKDTVIIAVGLGLFVIMCCVIIPYCIYYKCQEANTTADGNITTPNNIEDSWTRPPVASVLDPPPAYPNGNTGIMEYTPSAPYLAYVDVNGNINDDPPSYYEVIASS